MNITDNDEISIDIDNQLHKWFLIDQHNHRGIIYTIFTLYLDHFLWFDRRWLLWCGFLDRETITKLISWISFLFLWTFFSGNICPINWWFLDKKYDFLLWPWGHLYFWTNYCESSSGNRISRSNLHNILWLTTLYEHGRKVIYKCTTTLVFLPN